MRGFFRGGTRSKTGSDAGSGPPTGAPPQMAPMPQSSMRMDGGDDDLHFLPPGRQGIGELDQPRRPMGGKKDDSIAMPGAFKSRLGGLFNDDDGMDIAPVAPKAKQQEPRPEASQPVQAQPSQPTWSGSASLFRLSDDESAMEEQDPQEGKGNLFGVTVKLKSAGSPNSPDKIELVVYTAVKKKTRIRASVLQLDLQPPNGESVSFYDEQTQYWALQLSTCEEAISLTRVLLAAKAYMSGSLEIVEMQPAAGEEYLQAECEISLCATLCMQDSAEGHVVAEESATEVTLKAKEANTRWGAGVGDILADQGVGSSLLVAVPTAFLPAAWRDRSTGGRCVLLVDLETIYPAGTDSSNTAVAETTERKRSSIKDRMAKLGVSALPSQEGGATATRSFDSPPRQPLSNPGPYGSPPSTMPSLPTRASVNAQTQPAQIGMGENTNVHPAAEVVRQYWQAVQDSNPGNPYAYLGSLPFIPGLQVPYGQQAYGQHQQPPQNRMFQPGALPPGYGTQPPQPPRDYLSPSTPPPMTMPQTQMYEPPSPSPSPPGVGSTANAPMRTTPIGSVSLGELVEAIRDVVRKEATPEGHQAERQKLERRVALLEEQLNSTKMHSEQATAAHRSQLQMLQKQLADAQVMSQTMREQQMRAESDRQMRDWEKDRERGVMEAELHQVRSELQTLRLEERNLRDRLQDTQAAQQRAEGQAMTISQTASAIPALEASLEASDRAKKQTEAQLREQFEVMTVLRQELQAVSNMRKQDVVSGCENAISIAFVAIKSTLPGCGAWVDADAVRSSVKGVCQGCVKSIREEATKVDLGAVGTGVPPTPLGVNWDMVESSTSSCIGSTLVDEKPGAEAVQREAVDSGSRNQRLEQDLAALRADQERERRESARKLQEANHALESARQDADRKAHESQLAVETARLEADRKLETVRQEANRKAHEAVVALEVARQEARQHEEQARKHEASRQEAVRQMDEIRNSLRDQKSADEAMKESDRKRQEEEKKRLDREEQERKREEEERLKKTREEADRLAQEEQGMKEEEERLKKAKDEADRLAQEEAALQQAEEARRKEEEEEKHKKEEELAKEAEAEQKSSEILTIDPVQQMKADEPSDSQRNLQDQEEQRQAAEEEEEKKIKEEENRRLEEEKENERLRQAEEEKNKIEEESEKQRQVEEEERKRLEHEEKERVESESRRQLEEEERKRLEAEERERIEAENRTLEEEREKQRQAEEDESRRVAEESEKERLRQAEQENARIEEELEREQQRQAEEEKKRLDEEQEKERLRQAEEEKKRLEEEQEKERLRQAEEEKKRLEEEQEKERLRQAEAKKAAKPPPGGLFGDDDDTEVIKPKKKAAPKPSAGGLFGDDDDEAVPVKSGTKTPPKGNTTPRGGNLFGDDDDDDFFASKPKPKAKDKSGSAKKPPANLFGDD